MASLAEHRSYQTFDDNLPLFTSKGFPEGVIIFLELEPSSNFLHRIFQYPIESKQLIPAQKNFWQNSQLRKNMNNPLLWRRKNTQAIFPRIYFISLDLNYTDHQIGTCIWGAPIPLWLKELVVIFFKTSQQTGQQLFWLRVVFYGRIWKDGRSVSTDKARIISNLSGYFGVVWKALESKGGAEGGRR